MCLVLQWVNARVFFKTQPLKRVEDLVKPSLDMQEQVPKVLCFLSIEIY